MGLLSIYTTVSLLIIFLSIFIISFYIIKVAEKKYNKQDAIIKILADEFAEKVAGFIIIKNNLIILENNFYNKKEIIDKDIFSNDKTKIIDINNIMNSSQFITKKILIKNSEYYLIYFS